MEPARASQLGSTQPLNVSSSPVLGLTTGSNSARVEDAVHVSLLGADEGDDVLDLLVVQRSGRVPVFAHTGIRLFGSPQAKRPPTWSMLWM